MKKIKNALSAYWPELLILFSCMFLLSMAIMAKKGYHGDEMLSFQLANAKFNPWIVPTQPQGRLAKFVEREIDGDNVGQTISNVYDTVMDVAKRKGSSKLFNYVADVFPEPTWIDRERFVDYATVNKKDCFSYLSVYFNVKDDNHPPLFFMVLHTVSSLFWKQMNPWMGCGINLVFVMGIMILFMILGRRCMTVIGLPEQGRIAGDGAALVYGLSAGAFSTTLLIRMYAMLSFFCVLLLLVHVQKLFAAELGSGSFENNNAFLVLTTILGFWTQYFFLFFCLPLAACTAWILWRMGRKKELLRYVLSMMLAAAIGLLMFPFAIGDVFSSGRGVEALENLSAGLSGYGERIIAFLRILGMGCGMICVLCLLLLWIGKEVRKKKFKRQDKYFWSVLIIPVIAYFLLAARMSPYLVDRYIMPLFPLVLLVLFMGACQCLSGLFEKDVKKNRIVTLSIIGVMACSQLFLPGHWDNDYLYPDYAEQLEVATENENLPCICVCEGYGYYQNLPEFMQYEKTLLVTPQELQNRQEKESVLTLEEVVVLVKGKGFLSDVQTAMEQYDLYPEKTLYSSNLDGGDVILLFQKVAK